MGFTPVSPGPYPPILPQASPSFNRIQSESNLLNSLRSGAPAPAGSSKPDLIPEANEALSSADTVFNVIFKIALIAFNAFSMFRVGIIWTIGFAVGMVFHKEVDERISSFVRQLFTNTKLAITVIAGGGVYFYCFQLPGTLIVQAALFGADAGSRLAIELKKALEDKGSSVFWLIRP